MIQENPHLSEIHLIQDWSWKIVEIWHEDLCWVNGQVIRLNKKIFTQVEKILLSEESSKILLFNEANTINRFLLKEFEEKPKHGFTWKVGMIIWQDEKWRWPILGKKSLLNVSIKEMYNIDFWNIADSALKYSIPWYKKQSQKNQDELLKWLVEEFYKKTKLRDDIIQKWLLLREITLIK